MFPKLTGQPVQPSGPISSAPPSPFAERIAATTAEASEPQLKHRWLIIIVFCLFAGLIAETFLTASTSPMDFLLHPIIPPFNVVLYGAFDLLAREILVRRRAGLASALLLGAAYGVINEGVVAGTWYVVHPQGYALIGGVDWVWALSLTIFHAIISVITPIVFIEILFPSIHGKTLLRRRGIVISVLLLVACIFCGVVVLAPQPLLIFFYRMAVLVVAILFSLVALALPPSRSAALVPATFPPATVTPAEQHQAPSVWLLRISGFLAIFAYFFLSMRFPVMVAALLQSRPGGLVIAQGVDGAVLLAFTALVVWRGWSWSRRAGWSPRQNLALLLGAVTFTTLLLNLTEPQMGEAFSTIPFYALLIALTILWRRRATTQQPSPAAA